MVIKWYEIVVGKTIPNTSVTILTKNMILLLSYRNIYWISEHFLCHFWHEICVEFMFYWRNIIIKI